MRPLIPFIEIDGDNAEHIIARCGHIVGWDSSHYVVNYGFAPHSDAAKAYGVSSKGVFVLCDFGGNVLERVDDVAAFQLPDCFKKVLDNPMREIERPDQAMLNEHAQWLTEKSKEICEDNGCTEDEHHCESYSYYDITRNEFEDITDFNHVDICTSDYIQRQVDCALPLPFEGDGNALLEHLEECSD